MKNVREEASRIQPSLTPRFSGVWPGGGDWKPFQRFPRGKALLFGLLCGVGLLAVGCLIKPARVPTRHFILAPMPVPEHTRAAAQSLAVEVGFVRMPSYLLRDSMVIRKSATEIAYVDDALWAERLDECFRQALAGNLSSLLSAEQAYLPALERDRLAVRVSVSMEQFDVDIQGRGTLLAAWRLTAAGADKPLRSGQARLTRTGPSPHGNPQAIAITLSALTAEFSQELAQALREAAQSKP